MPSVQRMLRAADKDIRPDSHSLQVLDAGLGRLGLQFPGSFQVRDQGDMDQHGILMSYFMLELTDGLQEGLALDIAHGTAHLNDGNLGIGGQSSCGGSGS